MLIKTQTISSPGTSASSINAQNYVDCARHLIIKKGGFRKPYRINSILLIYNELLGTTSTGETGPVQPDSPTPEILRPDKQ